MSRVRFAFARLAFLTRKSLRFTIRIELNFKLASAGCQFTTEFFAFDRGNHIRIHAGFFVGNLHSQLASFGTVGSIVDLHVTHHRIEQASYRFTVIIQFQFDCEFHASTRCLFHFHFRGPDSGNCVTFFLNRFFAERDIPKITG